MATKKSFSYRFWHDKHGNFVVWQKPNVFLWIWIIALVLAIVFGHNVITKWLGIIGGISIIIWAALEVGWGVNYFRRTLGALVLLLIIVSRFL